MRVNSKLHGIIDYLVVLFLWFAPPLFGLPDNTAIFTYILGGIHLFLTVSTEYEVGFLDLIPFKVHGWIEFIFSFALLGIAFYLENLEGELSRNFYVGIAAVIFLNWMITDYSQEETEIA